MTKEVNIFWRKATMKQIVHNINLYYKDIKPEEEKEILNKWAMINYLESDWDITKEEFIKLINRN